MFAHKVRSVYIVALLLIAAAAVYLFWPRERPEQMRAGYIPPIPGLKAEEYPAVGGSPVTEVLRQVILAKALQLPGEVRRIPDNTVAVTFPRSMDVAKVKVYQHKLGQAGIISADSAYTVLLNGNGPRLLLMASEPSAAIVQRARTKDVGFEVKPIALNAFVFVVNNKNPVKSLLIDDLRGIFSGKITNWKQVGGADAPITVLDGDSPVPALAANSMSPGSRARQMATRLEFYSSAHPTTKHMMLDNWVMNGKAIWVTGLRAQGETADRVAEDPNAISFSTFYEEGVLNPNSHNRLLAIQDVQPTVQSIIDASYPFIEPIYAVVRADAKPGSPEVRLRDWLTSKNGQQLVMQAGFIPLTMVKNVPEE